MGRNRPQEWSSDDAGSRLGFAPPGCVSHMPPRLHLEPIECESRGEWVLMAGSPTANSDFFQMRARRFNIAKPCRVFSQLTPKGKALPLVISKKLPTLRMRRHREAPRIAYPIERHAARDTEREKNRLETLPRTV